VHTALNHAPHERSDNLKMLKVLCDKHAIPYKYIKHYLSNNIR